MKDSSLNNTNKDNGIKTSRLNTNQSQLYESLNKKTNLDQKVETGELMDKKKYSKTNSCKISPRNLTNKLNLNLNSLFLLNCLCTMTKSLKV